LEKWWAVNPGKAFTLASFVIQAGTPGHEFQAVAPLQERKGNERK
jgi:hypothetical protein